MQNLAQTGVVGVAPSHPLRPVDMFLANPYAGGGGTGTESGHPEKAQNNNRGPGKNPGGPGQGYQ